MGGLNLILSMILLYLDLIFLDLKKVSDAILNAKMLHIYEYGIWMNMEK